MIKTMHDLSDGFMGKYLLILLTLILFSNCNNRNSIAFYADNHNDFDFKALEKCPDSLNSEIAIEKILSEKINESDFELDTGFAFIKIGRFLSPDKSNALVIRFYPENSMTVYELNSNAWKIVYQQSDIAISRAYNIKAYTEDFNFDGINDIGLQNAVSNGAAIRYFRLWISKGNTFTYIPEFENVGNPVLLKSAKTIHGYSACCAFFEYWLSEYKWINNNLINTRELHITNYPPGIEAEMMNLNDSSERKVHVSKAEISLIDSIYGWNGWTLVPKGNLSRYYRWFEK